MLWGFCVRVLRSSRGTLIAIEASHFQQLNIGIRELKRFACLINYDSEGGSSSCERGTDRGFSALNKA